MSEPYPGIVIVGPTASGKSRLGTDLALLFRGEIISCDALQLYRRMDVGTAKVTAAERKEVPHHMLDILEPNEEFSAGAYQSAARKSLEEIRKRGRIPFVVGGTGFYLSALLEGLFDGPSRNEILRSRMKRIIDRKGPEVLYRALRRIDPLSADRISEADGERIIRAYEMYLVSGRTMSWWQQQPRNALKGYRWLKIGIHSKRENLYKKINSRVDEMFNSGFIDEVRTLLGMFPRRSPAFKAIGYRQVLDYLDGRVVLEEAVEETKKESRNYAKRQISWFRRDTRIKWIEDGEQYERLLSEGSRLIEAFLNREE